MPVWVPRSLAVQRSPSCQGSRFISPVITYRQPLHSAISAPCCSNKGSALVDLSRCRLSPASSSDERERAGKRTAPHPSPPLAWFYQSHYTGIGLSLSTLLIVAACPAGPRLVPVLGEEIPDAGRNAGLIANGRLFNLNAPPGVTVSSFKTLKGR